MKTLKWMIALLCCTFLFGCNDDSLKSKDLSGFWIRVGGNNISSSEIEYYDFSTHIIYFNEEQPFLKDLESGSFTVYVGDTEIYTGTIFPEYLNSLPTGPYISPFFTSQCLYALTIGLMDNQSVEDPRSDSRIVNALKYQRKYHAGLQVEVQSIRFLSNNKVSFDFELSNPDTFDYLVLDPDKMGIGLFHYFTNGLMFVSEKNPQIYTPRISAIQPEPWNSWKKEWMSVIRSGESKRFTITYDQFDFMPSGNYRTFFTFPGLACYNVNKKDLNQSKGRIWLGEIETAFNCVK